MFIVLSLDCNSHWTMGCMALYRQHSNGLYRGFWGQLTARKEMTILLHKKMVIRTGKGAEESFILTAKGKEVAKKMEGPNKKKEEFLREIRSIGKILPHIEKALLVRFKSNEDLKTSLQMQATREGKENMLR